MSPWTVDAFAITPQMYQVIPGIICCTAVVYKLLRWIDRRSCLAAIEKAHTTRKIALNVMERAVLEFNASGRSGDIESILSLSLLNLQERLQEGSLSPDCVVLAYMEKALEVTELLNCITDFLPECQTQLKNLDGKKKGLLYGIPVSIKDNVSYKGHDSTCGLKKFLQQPATEDSVVVQVLKKQGAIPFVKTNVPQSMLSYECSNPIFGQTINPHDHKRTPGGSSGGEAALIASGGSVLGIGSDIGGSIRVPAAFCGICGFKPTENRLSSKGIRTAVPGQSVVSAAVGPMARDVDSLALCMRALLCEDMFQLDPSVPPIPFNDEVFSSSKPLRIGYYESDEFWIPNTSMKRAVMETKQLLENAGHMLVPFKPLRTRTVLNELFMRGIASDGGRILMERLKGDIIDPTLKDLLFVSTAPKIIMKILHFLLKPFSPRISEILKHLGGVRSVHELWKLHVAKKAYCDEYIDAWKSAKLDVLLCPALGPALTAGYAGKVTVSSACNVIFNLLNFPSGVVPVSTVTEQDEEDLKSYVGYCNDLWDRTFKKGVSGAVGLPLAVQCVALPWQDELCLRLMKEVERVTQKKKMV
ncbi:vitamin D3 hydroxylase-associated protein-like [Stegostoma tigrinum]|uniref:vitamin D3 hydroxylase-associated protein-like n=1 Tax=Stegostoma tigrinum TaxID=3053191 RepID=UPI00286FCC3E|nr:vitamin D3 hydroxylase-associated protein-like [Stegostoma tigrinum]